MIPDPADRADRKADDKAQFRSEMAEVRADIRADLLAFENRFRRTVVTWYLLAQATTLIVSCTIIALLAIAVSRA